MTTWRTFPTKGALTRLPFGLVDVVLFLLALVVLYLVVTAGRAATVTFSPAGPLRISTDPRELPADAVRSLLPVAARIARVPAAVRSDTGAARAGC